MNQNQLNRAVAAATGETVGFVKSMGFGVVAELAARRRSGRYRRLRSRAKHRRRNGHAPKKAPIVLPADASNTPSSNPS